MPEVGRQSATLWEDFASRAMEEVQRRLSGRSVVSRDELKPELTPFGTLRWYMHPALHENVDQAHYFFEVEIPPGSRTGRWAHQGGILSFIAAGEGHTVLNGRRIDWQTLDLLAMPPLVKGITFQHFNEASIPARIITVIPNYDSSLGPAMGADMRIEEPAPEYVAARS